MTDRFPYLNDSAFPDLGNVNVYKFQNEFDYSRYDDLQMQIQMCNVPWDMGEAHIGNRTISGIGNVVYFETKAKRDKWFDDIPDTECYRFNTKFKELHRSNQIDVPIPFDVASKFNYLAIDYSMFANDNSLVEYEKTDGLRRWFWFIREVEFLAPNTTRLYLMADAWQTFIYDLNIAGMILERGHAPMVEMDAATYLANPVARSQNLLASDVVNENSADISFAANELIFNEKNIKAVIITTANPVTGSWGSKSDDSWRVDGERHFMQDGVPSYCAFALDASSLSTFLDNVSSTIPQFMQTIQGVCFISSNIITLGTSFTFASVSCNMVSSSYKTNTILDLEKTMFGYPANYADIAKLYTYPYAYIQLSDETGSITDIRIEQTDGTIEYASCINLVYPWLQINGHVTSKGRGNAKSITFKNVTDRSISIKGDWYNTLNTWSIPVFGITQDAGEYNDYATHYDRLQEQYAATNQQTSSNASADTALDNSNANADTAVAIANLQIAANTANVAANTTKIHADNTADQATNVVNTMYANTYIWNTTNNQIQADEQRASIAAGAASAKAGISAVSSLFEGNIIGAIGAVANGGVEASSILASNSVTVNQTSTQAGLQESYNNQQRDTANLQSQNKEDNAIDNAELIRDNQNSLTSGTTAASAATMRANATRDNTTERANATRAYNTATNAIDMQIAQAEMETPKKFGDSVSGDTATTRPIGIFADIVTQDPYSIAYAGDEMLRYGYMLNRQWNFNGNWNNPKCKYFCYWKLSDFWVANLSIPDMYVDRIRFFLYGGVTVWRDPAFIGYQGIYDNIDWS